MKVIKEKTEKPTTGKEYKEKVGIKGEFLDVFKVIKKHKENKTKNR